MKIPKERVYTSEEIEKKLRGFKRMASLSPMGGYRRRLAGKELFIETSEGRMRVLGYGLDDPDRLPLFINIHGGGFVIGHPDMDDPFLAKVALGARVKILSLDYSLAPESPFPKALDECYAAVQYAKGHAAELGIDPEKIAVGGHSAGGNFSAGIGIMDGERRELGLKCLILDYPPTDVYTDAYLKPQPKGALKPSMCRLFDAAYCLDKEARKNPLISPVYARPEQLRGFPPTLIITAGRDSLCKETEEFRDKLIAAGVTVKHRRFEGSRHGFTLSDKPDAKEGWQMMIDFLKLHLRGE